MKIFLCYFFIFFPVFAYAQSKIGYVYDMAGNRVKREIVMPSRQAMCKNQKTGNHDCYTERLREHSVKIYSNTTNGNLKVCISNLSRNDKCHMNICSVQGVQIRSFDVSSDNVCVDLSDQPNGIYLFTIAINGTSTTWKIIKK